MSFQWPCALLSLVAVTPIVILLLRRPQGRWARALFAAGLVVMVVAIARPHATVSVPRVEGTLILAVDNSNSMLATDADPTRIVSAKNLARQLVDSQPATVNIGVVSFSSGGVVLQQPTTRHEQVHNTIDRLRPDGGTSLAEGLFASLGAVVGDPISIDQETIESGDLGSLDIGFHGGSVIVVFSDGENRNGSDPLAVAGLAANAGVRVFAIGVGETAGTTLDVDGYTLATALNEASLMQVAERGGGAYFHATQDVDLDQVSDAIDLDLTFRGEESEVTALVAAVGSVLLLIGATLSMLWFGRVL